MPELDLRPPKQERTQAAWERVLDAGVALLEESGYEGFTIAAICERAQVTPPNIYARVRNKQTLFFAVFEHGFEPVRRQQREMFDGLRLLTGSPEAVIRDAVGAIARTTLAHDQFLRPIILRAEADPEVAARTREARVEVATRFRALVLQHAEALRDPRPQNIDACFRIIFAALLTRITHAHSFDIGEQISDEQLIDDLAEMTVRSLLKAPRE